VLLAIAPEHHRDAAFPIVIAFDHDGSAATDCNASTDGVNAGQVLVSSRHQPDGCGEMRDLITGKQDAAAGMTCGARAVTRFAEPFEGWSRFRQHGTERSTFVAA
jgi:hypothetical protein